MCLLGSRDLIPKSLFGCLCSTQNFSVFLVERQRHTGPFDTCRHFTVITAVPLLLKFPFLKREGRLCAQTRIDLNERGVSIYSS